jgi:hypothetical protein
MDSAGQAILQNLLAVNGHNRLVDAVFSLGEYQRDYPTLGSGTSSVSQVRSVLRDERRSASLEIWSWASVENWLEAPSEIAFCRETAIRPKWSGG